MKYLLQGLFLSAVVSMSAPLKAQHLYGIEHDTGFLYEIDLTTLQLSVVGDTNINNPGGLQFNNAGQLHSFSTGYPAQLWRINEQTALATYVNNLGVSIVSEGSLAMSAGGKTWASTREVNSDSVLFRVSLFAGGNSYQDVGPFSGGFRDISGMAHREDGQLVGIDALTNMLVTIDPATANVTDLAQLVPEFGSIGGMTIYGKFGYFVTQGPAGGTANPNEIWRFDPFTGSQTFVGSLGNQVVGNGLSGLASRIEPIVLADPTPGTAGVTNTFEFSSATPGDKVAIVYGQASGQTSVGPTCPGLFYGMDSGQLAGVVFADSVGSGSFSAFVSPVLSGQTFYIQALDAASCNLSNLVVHTFL